MKIAIYDREPEGDGKPQAYVSPPPGLMADTQVRDVTEGFWNRLIEKIYDEYIEETDGDEEPEKGYYQGSFEDYLVSKGWTKELGPDLVIHI